MPQITIPLTTYQIKQNRPAYPIGSPGNLAVQNTNNAIQRVLARVPIDHVPVGAIITSAVVQFWTAAAKSGATPLRIFPITQAWKSSVTWSNRPPIGSVITTTSITSPVVNALYSFSVTAWANSRSRNGLMIDTTLTSPVSLRGSAAAVNKPVMVVDYYTPNSQPTGLSPHGGAVSVPTPILSYNGDEDMDHQQIQYSSDGSVAGITFDTGSIPAASGRYDPAASGAPVLTPGQVTFWRVMTTGGGGTSPWSPWVSYSYQPIVQPVIVNPPSVTDDGSPDVNWTVADQVSWQAELQDGGVIIAKSVWDVDSTTRDWFPAKGVKVPGGHGRIVLRTTDSIVPRVAAEGAPVWSVTVKEFDTVHTGNGPVVTNLAVSFSDPFPVITGTRTLGIPDDIALIRDGVAVTIWDADGNPTHWAPGTDFFTGTNFAIRDLTADLRVPHTWSVLTRINGVTSAIGPEVTETFSTGSVWMVNPRTGSKVEIFGNDDVPAVAQLTEEGSILHTPVHGNLIVEPVRRRLMRTTRSGSIEGLVLNSHEGRLNSWALADSGLHYRLIFGKVNWPIIFGDYSPTDVFYSHPDPECDDTLVLILLNWWERLDD
jgi:hypothetical protein